MIKFSKMYDRNWRTFSSYPERTAEGLAEFLSEKIPNAIFRVEQKFIMNQQSGEEYNEFMITMEFDNESDEAYFLLQYSDGVR